MSVITVTAGHSNKDPGAVNGLFREADIAQEMRNMVARATCRYPPPSS